MENVALGAGGFSMLSYMDESGRVDMFSRDTFNVAIKPIMVYKDPKTDSGMKKSHKGCCAVFYNHVTNEFDCDEGMTLKEAHEEPFNLLRPIFVDGKMIEETSLTEIRKILWNGRF